MMERFPARITPACLIKRPGYVPGTVAVNNSNRPMKMINWPQLALKGVLKIPSLYTYCDRGLILREERERERKIGDYSFASNTRLEG